MLDKSWLASHVHKICKESWANLEEDIFGTYCFWDILYDGEDAS